jgi:hypothetical protein
MKFFKNNVLEDQNIELKTDIFDQLLIIKSKLKLLKLNSLIEY